MEWSLRSDRPIWLQLCEQMERRIVTGQYPPGSRLPSVRELAAEAGVNPNTMQRALQQLEQENLTVTHRTAGRMVTEDTAAVDAIRRKMARDAIEAFYTATAQLGYSRQEAAELLKEDCL